MMGTMATIVAAALLGIALINLAIAFFRWRAGGKHQVLTSLLIAAVAASMLFPDGSGRRTAALWVAAGLMAVALMTTPGARLRRMRLELTLLGAAIAVILILTLVQLPSAVTMAGLVLPAALVLAAFGVMIVRANRAE